MPNINEINTAVYKLLNTDTTLPWLCTVYKGTKRPSNAVNPSVTAVAKRLEAGDSEGMWMCDIVVTAYADTLANRMPDHETIEALSTRIRTILADSDLDLDDAKAFPLIEGGCEGPEWDNAHDVESSQEMTFGLVFVKFQA